jgi:hypothetical protein
MMETEEPHVEAEHEGSGAGPQAGGAMPVVKTEEPQAGAKEEEGSGGRERPPPDDKGGWQEFKHSG